MTRLNSLAGVPRQSGSATRLLAVLVVLANSMAAVESRGRPEPDPQFQYDDLARLASHHPREELLCELTPDRPVLGFDLRFHSDYHATVPLKALIDAGGWFKVAMRVTSTSENEPTYLARRFTIPKVPAGIKGDVDISDGFALGSGSYRVDWVMRDARERVCSAHWRLETKTSFSKRDLPLTLGPNEIVDVERDAYGPRPETKQDAAQSLHVKILLNLSPATPQESILRPEDAAVLFDMLRCITGQPGIVVSTVVAFNLREQKIVYRQEDSGRIDFAALERSTHSRTSGTIDISLLRDPQSETHFVTRLLTDELGAQADSHDAIIIVGAKVSLQRSIPRNSLKAKGSVECPVFYFNYTSKPNEPWSDTIGSALKAYKAAAYTIEVPRDLVLAITELLSRINKRPNS
jgi:hypothetical protein